MRAILINAVEQTVTEVEVENSLQAVHDLIDCDLFERVNLDMKDDGTRHDIWVDESGMLPHRYKGVRFMTNSYPDPLCGNGLILGEVMTDEGPDWGPCTLTLEEACGMLSIWIKDIQPNGY